MARLVIECEEECAPLQLSTQAREEIKLYFRRGSGNQYAREVRTCEGGMFEIRDRRISTGDKFQKGGMALERAENEYSNIGNVCF